MTGYATAAARETHRQLQSADANSRPDCFSTTLVADGVSQPDGISRGPRRRDPSGGSGKAISSGRRRIRGPAHRNPQRQVVAGARTPRTTESAVSSLLPPSIDRCTIVSAEWPGRCALWRSLGLWTIENRTERKEWARRLEPQTLPASAPCHP